MKEPTELLYLWTLSEQHLHSGIGTPAAPT